ncbi:flagellar filament capping protein FliD [Pseudomonas mendocina]|nr:flagellar filament capping protein FliD [Pseudomonas mendocina]MBH3340830.1 flagellar filament capping protein FliD [Pseudomonas mendocina]
MAGILGVGTNLPIDTIVDALLTAERTPKTAQLDRLEKESVARRGALISLKGAVSNFKAALNDLNKPALFEARTATSSNTSLLKVTSGTTTPAGSYDVQIRQLASGSKVALQSVPGGNTATFNSGTMTISTGSSSLNVNIDESNNTLAGMRDAINEAGKSSGISATILTDASGSRLILNSTKMGDGNDIKVAVTEDGATTGNNALTTQAFEAVEVSGTPGSFVPPDSASGAGGVITSAKSALLTIDGLQMARDSNTVTDAIEGVTLNLAGAQTSTDLADGKNITVTVGVDKSGVKSNVKKFVDAYNALITKTAELTAVVPVTGDDKPVAAALVGDSTIRNLVGGLRNEMVAMTGDGAIKALANLGISTNFTPSGGGGSTVNGTLSIDDAKLTAALDSNFDEVAGYLTGDTGLLGRLSKVAEGYTQAGGVLQQREEGLATTIKNVDEQRKALDLRMEKMKTRLVAQYTALDTLVANLTRTSESLATQLANLPGFVRKDK